MEGGGLYSRRVLARIVVSRLSAFATPVVGGSIPFHYRRMPPLRGCERLMRSVLPVRRLKLLRLLWRLGAERLIVVASLKGLGCAHIVT